MQHVHRNKSFERKEQIKSKQSMQQEPKEIIAYINKNYNACSIYYP